MMFLQQDTSPIPDFSSYVLDNARLASLGVLTKVEHLSRLLAEFGEDCIEHPQCVSKRRRRIFSPVTRFRSFLTFSNVVT